MGKGTKVQSKVSTTQHDYKTATTKAKQRELSELKNMTNERFEDEESLSTESTDKTHYNRFFADKPRSLTNQTQDTSFDFGL